MHPPVRPGTEPARRRLLGTAAAAAAVAFFGAGGRALAAVEDLEKAIREFGDGAGPVAGTITLSVPEIAENGNGVPVAFAVESPMTERDHVESVMILATDNPSPRVATFHFTPRSGAARAATRMRLAGTQDVVAVARLSDGTLHRASANVQVTIGGCGA